MTSSFLLNTVGNQGIEAIRNAALEGKGQDKIGGTFERLWDRIADFFTGSNRVAAKENLYTLFSPDTTDTQKYDAFLQLRDLAKSGHAQDFGAHANASENGVTLKINLGFGEFQEFHLNKLPSVDHLTISTLGFNQNFESAKEHMAKFLSPDSTPAEQFNAFYRLRDIAESSGHDSNFQIKEKLNSDGEFDSTLKMALLSGGEEVFATSGNKIEILTQPVPVEINYPKLQAEVQVEIDRKDTQKIDKQFLKDVTRSGVIINGEMAKSIEAFENLTKKHGYSDAEKSLIKRFCVQTFDAIVITYAAKDLFFNPGAQGHNQYTINKTKGNLQIELINKWDAFKNLPLETEKKGETSIMDTARSNANNPVMWSPAGGYQLNLEFSSAGELKPNTTALIEITRYAGPIPPEPINNQEFDPSNRA